MEETKITIADDGTPVEPEWFKQVVAAIAASEASMLQADEELIKEIEEQDGSEVIHLANLRKAYSIKSDKANVRTSRRISFTEEVWEQISQLVPTGKGQYGTPFVEIATRLFCAILLQDNDAIQNVAENLKKVTNDAEFTKGLLRLYSLMAAISNKDK